jgi:hypothetical protein
VELASSLAGWSCALFVLRVDPHSSECRPLVLQLYNSPEEYGEFLHKPGQKFYDFDMICKEIEDDTNKGVCTREDEYALFSITLSARVCACLQCVARTRASIHEPLI